MRTAEIVLQIPMYFWKYKKEYVSDMCTYHCYTIYLRYAFLSNHNDNKRFRDLCFWLGSLIKSFYKNTLIKKSPIPKTKAT